MGGDRRGDSNTQILFSKHFSFSTIFVTGGATVVAVLVLSVSIALGCRRYSPLPIKI